MNWHSHLPFGSPASQECIRVFDSRHREGYPFPAVHHFKSFAGKNPQSIQKAPSGNILIPCFKGNYSEMQRKYQCPVGATGTVPPAPSGLSDMCCTLKKNFYYFHATAVYAAYI
jgi:hypothetical protein